VKLHISRVVVGLFLVSIVIAVGGCATTNAWMQADKLFKDGEYAEAADAYAKAAEKYPQRRELVFNRGAALHMNEDFIGARKVFGALAREADTELQEKCEYNTGNGYLREGENEKAITHYKRALYLDPADINAKWNLELAQGRQQQKQDQEQQQKQDQEQQQKQDQEQQQQDQKRNQNEEKDNQQKKEQQKQPPEAKQQEPEPKPQSGELSEKEAERLLRALAEQDKQLQKQLRKPDEPAAAPHDRDW
jgi:Ca-activated chloride channel homolog